MQWEFAHAVSSANESLKDNRSADGVGPGEWAGIAQVTPGSTNIRPPVGSQVWEYTLTIAGYIVPKETSYVNPV